MNWFRKKSLILLLLVSLFFVSNIKVEAFSIGFNPVSLFRQVSAIITDRVSDIIYYLVMQKKYIFDDFKDPNIYPKLNIPADLDGILLSTSSSTTTKTRTSAQPIAVTTSTVSSPQAPKTNLAYQAPVSTPAAFPAPVIKSSSVLPPVSASIPNYTNDSVILSLTNEERLSANLNSLKASPTLDMIADLRADDLFANQYFEHESPDNKSASDLAKNLNYDYLLIGENLALGNFTDEAEIVSAWMDSPGHRANILNSRYTELGTALKFGIYKGQSTTIAVQIFSLPLANCPKPDKATKDLIDSSTVSVSQMQAEALAMYSNLNLLKTSQNLDKAYYYQKVQEYNYFAKKTNDAIAALQGMINLYNLSVDHYNACVGAK